VTVTLVSDEIAVVRSHRTQDEARCGLLLPMSRGLRVCRSRLRLGYGLMRPKDQCVR